MSGNGWVKLHRQSLESAVFQNANLTSRRTTCKRMPLFLSRSKRALPIESRGASEKIQLRLSL